RAQIARKMRAAMLAVAQGLIEQLAGRQAILDLADARFHTVTLRFDFPLEFGGRFVVVGHYRLSLTASASIRIEWAVRCILSLFALRSAMPREIMAQATPPTTAVT